MYVKTYIILSGSREHVLAKCIYIGQCQSMYFSSLYGNEGRRCVVKQL